MHLFMLIFLATVFGLQMWNGVGTTETVWLTGLNTYSLALYRKKMC